MGVYQDWQRDVDEAENKLRKGLKDAKGSAEPPTDEYRRKIRKCSIEILEMLDRLS